MSKKNLVSDALIALQNLAEKAPETEKRILSECIETLGTHLCKNFDTGLGDRVLCIYKDGSKAFWKPTPPHRIRR